jgi:hypothetical protein
MLNIQNARHHFEKFIPRIWANCTQVSIIIIFSTTAFSVNKQQSKTLFTFCIAYYIVL